jgi:ribosomal protein L11
MKKKYGLESIIGKKSKLRFPRHAFIPKVDTLNFILPANAAIAEPPLSTAITMKKGDPFDFCDQFNEESYDFEEGLPLNVIVYLSITELLFEIKSPTIFSLFSIIFDLEDFDTEKFRATKDNIFLSIFNFALIKLNPEEDFFISELLSQVRSIYGNLLSYNCRRKFKRRSPDILPQNRLQRFLINKKPLNHVSQLRSLNAINHFFYKTSKFLKHNQVLQQINQIDELYDLLDDWDDAYDYIWEDLEFTKLFELFERSLITNHFYKIKNDLLEKNNTKITGVILGERLNKFKNLSENNLSPEYNLLLPIKLLTYQYKLNIIN